MNQSRLPECVPKPEPLPYQLNLWPEYATAPWLPLTIHDAHHSALVAGPTHMVGYNDSKDAQVLNL